MNCKEDLHIVAFCLKHLEQLIKISQFEVNPVDFFHVLSLRNCACKLKRFIQVDVHELRLLLLRLRSGNGKISVCLAV